MSHILVVEDESTLAAHLNMLLTQAGFTCSVANDADVASRLFRDEVFDLVLLDLHLPSRSGMELCREFRGLNTEVPIIVLTAFSDLDTKLLTFDYGADDFLSKPFHGKELLAKVQVFLRRTSKEQHTDEVWRVGDLEVVPATMSVRRSGQKIILTPKEYALLELLITSQGRVISKIEIARKVWNVAFDTGTNAVEVYVSFLRNKVDKPFATKLIHTKPGFGYYLADDEL